MQTRKATSCCSPIYRKMSTRVAHTHKYLTVVTDIGYFRRSKHTFTAEDQVLSVCIGVPRGFVIAGQNCTFNSYK
jgi:hypothetical protein